MNFIPFDKNCFEQIKRQLGHLFEEELLDEICRYGQLRQVPEDQIMMDVGDSIDRIPLVIKGSIKILTEDKEGNPLLLYYISEYDTCSVTLKCCTNKVSSSIQAVTETPCEIWFIPSIKMDEWMVKYTSWRRYILDSYDKRLNELIGAIDHIVFDSLEERLDQYLRQKSALLKSSELNLSHAQIASELHTSRVVISRLMKKMVIKGVIEQKRNKIRYL